MKEQANPKSTDHSSSSPGLLELVREQCDLAVRATEVLSDYLENQGEDAAEQIRRCEREADSLRSNSFETVRRKFFKSPLREEVHRAINSIIAIIHHAQTTVREMEALDLSPDRHLKQMSTLIQAGALSLQAGYKKLAAGSQDVEENVEAARQTERDTEEAYRSALADLFDARSFMAALDSREHHSDTKFLGRYLAERQDHHGAAAKALAFVVDLFRRREILGHLSSTAYRVLLASDALHEVAARIRSEKVQNKAAGE